MRFVVIKKKKKISPTSSTSKSQVRTCGVNFRKIKIFVFMVLKALVQTCELRGHKKKNFPNPLDIEVTDPAGPVASISEKPKYLFLWS